MTGQYGTGGGGGTTSAYGSAGTACGFGSNGNPGTAGAGGSGGAGGGVENNGGGGGGGAGYYGGGGGGGSCYDGGGGGGGGGSSYASTTNTSSTQYTADYEGGNGYLNLTYLLAGSPTPASPAIDLGQSIMLSSNPSDGTSPYSIQWRTGSSATCTSDLPVSGSTGSSYSASPNSSAYYCYEVTDNSVIPLTEFSSTVHLTVNPALAAHPIFPTGPTIASGQHLNLTANASGGTPPYKFLWYAGTSNNCVSNTLIGGQTNMTLAISPATNTTYCYGVSDSSSGSPAQGALSPTDQVTVMGGVTAGAVTPNGPVIDSGQDIVLNTNAHGGKTPYYYVWYSGTASKCSGDAQITGAINSTYSASPTSNTSYCYSVRDSNPGLAYSAVDMVTVNPPPVANPILPSSPDIRPGGHVELNATPSGGTLPYGFQWYSGTSASCSQDSKISGAVNSSYVASPAGNTTYCYTLADSSQGTPAAVASSAVDTVTVVSTGEGSPLISSFSANPSSIALGNSTTFQVTATGGTLPYTYAYTELPPGCQTSNTDSLSCTPSSAGNYNVTVTVTDARGNNTTSSPTPLKVIPPSSYPVIKSFVASPSSIDVGSSTTLTVDVTDGLAPYTFSYSQLPPGCSSANQSSISCTPSSSGKYEPEVTVIDARGHSVVATTPLTVNSTTTPAPFAVDTFTATPNPVTVNSTTTLVVVLQGGVSPYSYSYTGLPGACSSGDSANISCTPTSTGRFNVTVFVTDARGKGANKSLTLVVDLGSVTSKPGSSYSNFFPYILLALVAGVALLALYLALRNRSKKDENAEASAASGALAGGIVGGPAEWDESTEAESAPEPPSPPEPSTPPPADDEADHL